ncbi:unnamed protein product [Adineta ricciae]|uniref:Uncharacterized protein n=2 Tax=Adineta ricciae TaxID=249248 RepID=A0A815BJ60_ADIRI|nr:unnamed protein product [Adineta ricciae]
MASRPPHTRMAQNFLLIWFDELSNNDYLNTNEKFQQLVNIVYRCTDIDECIDFITDNENDIFLVVSGSLTELFLRTLHDISQVQAIYVFDKNTIEQPQLEQNWAKVKGIFVNIESICEALRNITHEYKENSISMSFVKSDDAISDENLNQLDHTFMYTRLLKEILFSIDFERQHINEFLTYCREQFIHNISTLQKLDILEQDYHTHEPIWWYTQDFFLYSMLNQALRTMDIDQIMKLGFFVKDLHLNIVKLYSQQNDGARHVLPFTVYRGQGLSPADFSQLIKTRGGLMSFNNFLSTSLDQTISFAFAESNHYNPDLIGILFQIFVDPSISSTPFASIDESSQHRVEKEILFTMHTVFRVGDVQRIHENNRLWKVELILTSDTDSQLETLTECMRKQTHSLYTGWHRLGKLLLKLSDYVAAEKLYETLLERASDDRDELYIHSCRGQIREAQGRYDDALACYQKSLQIAKKNSEYHFEFSSIYNNIGILYLKMEKNSYALINFKKALEFDQKIYSPNHITLASYYNNIACAYQQMGRDRDAMPWYKMALEIQEKELPPNHPDLALTYNNISRQNASVGNYTVALFYAQKALAINVKVLPPHHDLLYLSYERMGSIYERRGEDAKALLFYQKAIEICEKIFPPGHPDFIKVFDMMSSLYDKIGEYSKAQTYFETAYGFKHAIPVVPHSTTESMQYNMNGILTLKEKLEASCHPNEPTLMSLYNKIALTYESENEFFKALLYHEKVLKILWKTRPQNYPHLAECYNKIAMIYYSLNDLSNARTAIQHAIQIGEDSLTADHRDLQDYRSDWTMIMLKLILSEFVESENCSE